MLAHLLKYDSTQGNYVAQGHTVDFHEGEGEDNYIVVDGKKIVDLRRCRTLLSCPWGKLGVDVVLECTGFYTSKAKAQAHIDAGAPQGRYLRSCRQRSARPSSTTSTTRR